MDEFTNIVPKSKFNSTNDLWNRLGLSSSWSLGYTSQLIKKKSFKNKEEWYNFYFESGKERLSLIKKLPIEEQNLLNSDKPNNYKGKNAYLNYNYGRTKEEISEKGLALYKALLNQGNPMNLEIAECQFTAFFRTVAETWNGIYLREYNTTNTILDFFRIKMDKYISLIDTTGSFDYNYAIDLELYFDGEIICGIQIKPESYLNSTKPYVLKAKDINRLKNNKYTNKYNRPTFYVYSNQKGEIKNSDILLEINKIIKTKL